MLIKRDMEREYRKIIKNQRVSPKMSFSEISPAIIAGACGLSAIIIAGAPGCSSLRSPAMLAPLALGSPLMLAIPGCNSM